ncbi:MAG: histidine phosphatase family protein [Colwellia sp.]|nr:histidine phosphatase family protein [Colwellia sp.]
MKLFPRLMIFLSFVVLSMPTFADDIYSIYLVRHAEKQKDSDNPPLTSCGRLRARQLATILADVKLNTIYSTTTQRTMATALPISQVKKLAIKNYSAKNLTQFAFSLKQLKQNVLVVGHSNTTPQLVELLSDEKVLPIEDHQYQHLYQVQFFEDKINLTLLKQPLICR